MLDLFLSLLTHLQTLLKTRNANNRAIFNDHIEPIYGGIQTVYDDYVATFERTRGLLRDDGTSLELIIAELKTKRKEKKRLRQELVTYSTVFERSARFPEEFSTFCFYSSKIILREPTALDVPLSPMTTQMGPFIELLEQWSDPRYRDWFGENRKRFDEEQLGEHPVTERDFREFAAGCLSTTLFNMADHWKLVMESYYELRVKHLKPA